MKPLHYPWPWLADTLSPAFAVRYPWRDAVQQYAHTAEALCVLFPEVVGSLASWGVWLEGLLEDARPLVAPGPTVSALAAALTQLLEDDCSVAPTDAMAFLAEARRIAPHVAAVPLLLVDPDADCIDCVRRLLAAQQAINYAPVRPILVRRRLPEGWSGDVVRFGLPEPIGDLHRLQPLPTRNLAYWTKAYLALTVIWEIGAVPVLADDLWEELTVTCDLTLRESRFDEWVTDRLQQFALDTTWSGLTTVPPSLAFEPLPTDHPDAELLWQRGAVGYVDGWFDLTPLRGRTWLRATVDPSAHEGLIRRRLVNAPLARWLAAWAASVEESLRVLTLQFGRDRFRSYLRRAIGPKGECRLDELDQPAPEDLVGKADFADLVKFVLEQLPKPQRAEAAGILERCRRARNQVVHQRTAYAADILAIAAAVEWLATKGLI